MDGQKQQNAEVEQHRLTSLINSMTDGVIALNDDTTVSLYNGAALNILDLNSSMFHTPIQDIMHLVDEQNNTVDVVQLIKNTTTGTTFRDYSLKYADGSLINLYLSIAPVHVGYGDRGGPGYVVMMRDITREKALEEERDEFISVVSHELRNPVAIVEGNISNAKFVVEKNNDISTVKHALDQAYEQIAFLAGLIEDLATLSRAERGVLNLEVDDINPYDFVEELASNYRKDAEKKGLQLQTQLDPNLELLHSSKLHVREVLQNFITNAIKYTEHGGVTIGAKPQSGGVLFTIQDTGIGISTADKNRLFEKFFRSDDPRTRKQSGTGLGLYVTMKLASILNAKVTLDSELNKGSTFSIFIPDQDKPASQSPPALAPSPGAGAHA